MILQKPCSSAVAEDIIKLLLTGRETGGGDIWVLQVWWRKQWREEENQQHFCWKPQKHWNRKVLTNNSGCDHHSNVVAEALCIKLRVADNLRHLRIFIRHHNILLVSHLDQNNIERKLTVYSMWLLVSGGLKPLASYSPTRTFTRLGFKHQPTHSHHQILIHR